MAKLKSDNLRSMTDPELEQTLLKLREDLFKVRLEARAGRIEKPHRLREVKTNIARCYSIMKEKKSGRSQ